MQLPQITTEPQDDQQPRRGRSEAVDLLLAFAMIIPIGLALLGITLFAIIVVPAIFNISPVKGLLWTALVGNIGVTILFLYGFSKPGHGMGR